MRFAWELPAEPFFMELLRLMAHVCRQCRDPCRYKRGHIGFSLYVWSVLL